MTVAELIAALQAMPANAECYIDGGTFGLHDEYSGDERDPSPRFESCENVFNQDMTPAHPNGRVQL